MKLSVRTALALIAIGVLCLPAAALAQGVTTGSITGTVTDAQKSAVPGASVVATHEPSGTRYEATTRADGRFSIPGMRVGGPYTVKASLSGFQPQADQGRRRQPRRRADLELTPGAGRDHRGDHGHGDSPPRSSPRRAPAPRRRSAATRSQTLPTISDRLNDFARLSPQYSGGGSFVGQDNRLNNITVDGSYFNNSFGLGGAAGRPHGRDADLDGGRRGDPGQRRALRRAPGPLRRRRRQRRHPQRRQPVPRLRLLLVARQRPGRHGGQGPRRTTPAPSTFTATAPGCRGPIIKDKLFFFASYENDKYTRPARPSAPTRAARRWPAT